MKLKPAPVTQEERRESARRRHRIAELEKSLVAAVQELVLLRLLEVKHDQKMKETGRENP
jgi:ribosome recycling factor